MATTTTMDLLVVMVVVFSLYNTASAHSFEMGRCKKMREAQNFQPDQLTGKWFMIKIFSTSSSCMTITFNRTESGFTGTEGREMLIGRKFGVDHILRNTGYFTIKNNARPAQMEVRWPSSIFGTADVTVMDIEPDSFAVLYECKNVFWVAKRNSATILSRERTLDPAIIARIEEDLEQAGIDVGDFDVMSHERCNVPGDVDFDIHTNDYIGDGFAIFGSGRGGNSDGDEDSLFIPEFVDFKGINDEDNGIFT